MLGRIHRSGDIDVFPKLSMVGEPTTDDYKSQGTQMTLDSYSRINDLMSMEWNRWKEGIKASSINQHEVLNKAI